MESNLQQRGEKLNYDVLTLIFNIVTAYLSGYTERIWLRLNLYFQHIKKLLQSKKVTYI